MKWLEKRQMSNHLIAIFTHKVIYLQRSILCPPHWSLVIKSIKQNIIISFQKQNFLCQTSLIIHCYIHITHSRHFINQLYKIKSDVLSDDHVKRFLSKYLYSLHKRSPVLNSDLTIQLKERNNTQTN